MDQKHTDKLIKEYLRGTELTPSSMARLFSEIHKGDFVSITPPETITDANPKAQWYHFKNHRWTLTDYQSINITSKMLTLFTEYAGRHLTYGPSHSRCHQIIEILNKTPFRLEMYTPCHQYCYDPSFLAKRDQNKHLWVCENGVNDLKTGIFRHGKPEDYCTVSCDRRFYDYGKTHRDVREVNKILERTFVKRDVRRVFVDWVCMAMGGDIAQKPVLLGVGGPKSGKFVMISLLRYIFHNYALLIPNDILSSQLTKYSLLPKEMRLFFVDGVRFLDKANVLGLEKMINEISKDRISDRKVFMTTRNLPEGIVNNQIEVVNFESRFQIDPGYEVSTFEADRDLLNKLGILSSAFLWMCLTRRKVLEVKPRLITYLALEEGCPYNILESLDSFL